MATTERAVSSKTSDDAPLHEAESKPVKPTPPALDWDGPDDPENPFNWPRSKRIFHTVIPGLLAFTV